MLIFNCVDVFTMACCVAAPIDLTSTPRREVL